MTAQNLRQFACADRFFGLGDIVVERCGRGCGRARFRLVRDSQGDGLVVRIGDNRNRFGGCYRARRRRRRRRVLPRGEVEWLRFLFIVIAGVLPGVAVARNQVLHAAEAGVVVVMVVGGADERGVVRTGEGLGGGAGQGSCGSENRGWCWRDGDIAGRRATGNRHGRRQEERSGRETAPFAPVSGAGVLEPHLDHPDGEIHLGGDGLQFVLLRARIDGVVSSQRGQLILSYVRSNPNLLPVTRGLFVVHDVAVIIEVVTLLFFPIRRRKLRRLLQVLAPVDRGRVVESCRVARPDLLAKARRQALDQLTPVRLLSRRDLSESRAVKARVLKRLETPAESRPAKMTPEVIPDRGPSQQRLGRSLRYRLVELHLRDGAIDDIDHALHRRNSSAANGGVITEPQTLLLVFAFVPVVLPNDQLAGLSVIILRVFLDRLPLLPFHLREQGQESVLGLQLSRYHERVEGRVRGEGWVKARVLQGRREALVVDAGGERGAGKRPWGDHRGRGHKDGIL